MVEENWLSVVSHLLELASEISYHLENQTSVLISLEEGWDKTSQISSLVQVFSLPSFPPSHVLVTAAAIVINKYCTDSQGPLVSNH